MSKLLKQLLTSRWGKLLFSIRGNRRSLFTLLGFMMCNAHQSPSRSLTHKLLTEVGQEAIWQPPLGPTNTSCTHRKPCPLLTCRKAWCRHRFILKTNHGAMSSLSAFLGNGQSKLAKYDIYWLHNPKNYASFLRIGKPRWRIWPSLFSITELCSGISLEQQAPVLPQIPSPTSCHRAPAPSCFPGPASLHIVTTIRPSMSYRYWWSRSGVGKLRPTDQIQPTACFGKHSVVGTQPHSSICILSPAAFALQQQSGVVATDAIWAKAQDAYCLALDRKCLPTAGQDPYSLCVLIQNQRTDMTSDLGHLSSSWWQTCLSEWRKCFHHISGCKPNAGRFLNLL